MSAFFVVFVWVFSSLFLLYGLLFLRVSIWVSSSYFLVWVSSSSFVCSSSLCFYLGFLEVESLKLEFHGTQVLYTQFSTTKSSPIHSRCYFAK